MKNMDACTRIINIQNLCPLKRHERHALEIKFFTRTRMKFIGKVDKAREKNIRINMLDKRVFEDSVNWIDENGGT